MKKNIESVVQWFSGLCNDCAEKYEAKSSSDDLSGIIFDCKKMFCSGKVALQKDEFKSDEVEEVSPFILNSEVRPNRYS